MLNLPVFSHISSYVVIGPLKFHNIQIISKGNLGKYYIILLLKIIHSLILVNIGLQSLKRNASKGTLELRVREDLVQKHKVKGLNFEMHDLVVKDVIINDPNHSSKVSILYI